MYDVSIVLAGLQRIEDTLHHIIKRTSQIKTANDFMTSPSGVDLLDMVCMRLLAIGETVKAIDKRTDGCLLSDYPNIPWRQIMGVRDRIAHNYFEVNPVLIFGILKDNLQPLLATIQQIKRDLEKEKGEVQNNG